MLSTWSENVWYSHISVTFLLVEVILEAAIEAVVFIIRSSLAAVVLQVVLSTSSDLVVITLLDVFY